VGSAKLQTAVLVLNYNGREHLEDCLSSLAAIPEVVPASAPSGEGGPPVEVWVVDNGSTDDSLLFVRERFPWVQVLAFEENLGFSEAYNRAVAQVAAEWVLFLNNDTRVAPDILQALEACRHRHPRACAFAAVLTSWDGSQVDFLGGDTFFFGHAWQRHLGEPLARHQPEEHKLLFGCAGALLFHRQTFLELGGFDPDFFSFFEDVDLGWRANIAGHEVWLCPRARVFHKGHGSWKAAMTPKKRLLLERNGLACTYKNWGEERMGVFLLAACALAFLRSVWGYTTPELTPAPRCSADTLAHLAALGEFSRLLPRLERRRQAVQQRRRVADETLLPLFGRITAPPLPERVEYRRLYRKTLWWLGFLEEQLLPSWQQSLNAAATAAATAIASLWDEVLSSCLPRQQYLELQDPEEPIEVPLPLTRVGWGLWQALERTLGEPLASEPLEALRGEVEALRQRFLRENTQACAWAPPPVSLVVRTRDRLRYLGEALESVACQTVRPAEVVVVNDGGADPSPVLQRFREVLPVRLVSLPEPAGRVSAAQRGLAEARGALVGFLDDDDQLLPHHLGVLLGAFANGARVAYSDVEVRHVEGNDRVVAQGEFAAPFDPERLFFENYVPIMAVLFEAELAREVGGFDTSLAYFEDWDLWRRLATRAPFVHCPVVTAVYFLRPEEGHGSGLFGEHRWPHFARVFDKARDRVTGKAWAEYYRSFLEPRWSELQRLRGELAALAAEKDQLAQKLAALEGSRALRAIRWLRRLFPASSGKKP